MSEIKVEISEAQARLVELTTQVENGDSVTITRNGLPVARLMPISPVDEMTVSEALKALDQFREMHTLNGLSIREMIDEGRR